MEGNHAIAGVGEAHRAVDEALEEARRAGGGGHVQNCDCHDSGNYSEPYTDPRCSPKLLPTREEIAAIARETVYGVDGDWDHPACVWLAVADAVLAMMEGKRD